MRLVLAVVITVSTAHLGGKLVVQILVKRAAAAVYRDYAVVLEVAAPEIDWLHLRLRSASIVARVPKPGAAPLLSTGPVVFTYKPGGGLQGSSIDISGLNVTLIPGSGAESNLPAPRSDTPVNLAFLAALPGLSAQGAALRVTDSRTQSDLQLSALSLHSAQGRFRLSATGQFGSGERRHPVERLLLQGRLLQDRITAETVDIRLAGSQLLARVEVATDLQRASASYSAALHLPALLAASAGNLRASGTLDWRHGALSARGEVRGTQTRIPQWPADGDVLLNYEFRDGLLHLRSLELLSAGARLLGEGTLAFDPARPGTLRFQITGLRPDRFGFGFSPAVLSGAGEFHFPGLNIDQGEGTVRGLIRAGGLLPSGPFVLRWDPRRFDLRSPSLTMAGVTAEVAAGWRRSDGALQGHIRATAPEVARTLQLLSPAIPANLQGSAVAEATLAGTLAYPQVSGWVRSSHFEVAPGHPVEFEAGFDWRSHLLRMNNFQLVWRGQRLTAEAAYSTRSGAWQLQAGADPVTLDSLDLLPGTRGAVRLALTGKGNGARSELDLHAQGSRLLVAGEAVEALDLRGRFTSAEGFTATLGLNQTPEAGGRGGASLLLDPTTGLLQLRARLTRWQSQAGQAEFESEITGDWRDPSGWARLAAPSLLVAGQPAGPLQADARLRAGDLRISLSAERLGLSGTVNLKTSASVPFQIDLLARNFNASPWLPVPGLSALADARLQVRGDAGNFKSSRATLQLERLTLDRGGHRIRLVQPALFDYRDGLFSFPKLELAGPNTRLLAEGRFPIEANRDGDLRVSANLDLAALQGLLPFPLTGAPTIEVQAAGPLDRLRWTGAVDLAGLRATLPGLREPLEATQGLVRFTGGRIEWNDAAFRSGAARLDTSGHAPLDWLRGRFDEPATATFHLDGLSPATLTDVPAGLTGELALEGQATASGPQLHDLDAVARITRLNVAKGAARLQNAHPLRLSLKQGFLLLDPATLTSPSGELTLEGRLPLEPGSPLQFRARGTIDTSLFTANLPGLRLAGPASLQVSATGALPEPRLSGWFDLPSGTAELREPAVAAQNLSLRVEFEGTEARLARLSADVNGGHVEGSGSLRLEAGSPAGQIELTAREISLDYPAGLQSMSNADLRFVTGPSGSRLEGGLELLMGGYREPVYLSSEILRRLTTDAATATTATARPLQLDVRLATREPFIVQNNLAQLSLTTNLRLRGSLDRPILTGLLALEEGGQLFLQQRRFTIERGAIAFVNESRIEPEFNVAARSRINEYDVEARFDGPARDLRVSLSSSPALSEEDIYSVLLTGRPASQQGGPAADGVQSLAASLVATGISDRLTSLTQRLSRGSRVSIATGIISAEKDPTARLTIGQDLTDSLQLLYSVDLRDTGDQIWVADYALRRRLNARGVRQSDGSYRGDLRFDWRLGGDARARQSTANPKVRLTAITFDPPALAGFADVARKLKVKPGRSYDFFKIRTAASQLEQRLQREGFLEARVRTRLSRDTGLLHLSIDQGPRVQFAWSGFEPSRRLSTAVRLAWSSGFIDSQRREAAADTLQNELRRAGFLEAQADTTVTEAAGTRLVSLLVNPGARATQNALRFAGLPEDLRPQFNSLESRWKKFARTDPPAVAAAAKSVLVEAGYLQATVGLPVRESGVLTFPVDPGSRFRLGRVTVQALSAAPAPPTGVLPASGVFCHPALPDQAARQLLQHYRGQGYLRAEVVPTLDLRPDAAQADLALRVTPGPRIILAGISIAGAGRAGNDYIRRRLHLRPGAAYDLEQANRSRSDLYRTQAYSSVDFALEPLGGAFAPEGVQPAQLAITLKQPEPYRVVAGGYYDSERGSGMIADAEARNWLGEARRLGLRLRYDRQFEEQRLFVTQPFVRSLPMEMNLSLFRTRDTFEAFSVRTTGGSIQQDLRLERRFQFNWGYKGARSSFRVSAPELAESGILVTSALTSSLSRDTRDDLLDARRGYFTSHSFDFAARQLGTDFPFLKYFGQFFRYFPLSRRDPGVRPPFVFATAIRYGVLVPLSENRFVPTDRFFAGGGATIRGFGQNEVGPKFADASARGGNTVLILNQELRGPLYRWIDAVFFHDAGNVMERASQLRLNDLRQAAGLGLRLRTPLLLFRIDRGWKLDRRPGESPGGWFFSIGHTF